MLVCFRARKLEQGSRCDLDVDGGRADRGIEKVIWKSTRSSSESTVIFIEESADGTFTRLRAKLGHALNIRREEKVYAGMDLGRFE